MTPLCIHGFPADHCASCRSCPHGLVTSRCTRCRTAATSRARRVTAPAGHPAEQHAGYEIFFDPSVNGWLYRAPDAAPSNQSYRSAFLARKAVDRLADEPAAPAKRNGSKTAKRKS
jgi:hypothetical protein